MTLGMSFRAPGRTDPEVGRPEPSAGLLLLLDENEEKVWKLNDEKLLLS